MSDVLKKFLSGARRDGVKAIVYLKQRENFGFGQPLELLEGDIGWVWLRNDQGKEFIVSADRVENISTRMYQKEEN